MPFNPDAVIELKRREGLTQVALAQALSRLAEANSLETVTNSAISEWERGEHKPPLHYIDLLHMFARARGYYDLEFYQSPNKYNPPRV